MNRMIMLLAALSDAALPLLIDSALKGAAVLFLAGLSTLALARASAATRHLVWVFALAGLLVLPFFSAFLPGWRVLPIWTVAEHRVVSAGRTPSPAAMDVFSPKAERNNSLAVAEATPVPRDAVAAPLAMRGWLLLIWAAGCSLVLLRLVAAWWGLSRAARRCGLARDPRLAELVEGARQQLNLQRPVQILLDSRRTIPMVWGLFRPRLMLPAETLDWSENQLRSVLLHELAHVKRNDLAVQWLMQAVRAVHWFNPLVWFAAWRLDVECECACDNLVLANGVRASDYAQHVLQVATALVPARGSLAAGLAMARPSGLEGRLGAVLNQRLNRRSVSRALIGLALIAGLAVIIPVAMLRAADDRKGEVETALQPQVSPGEKSKTEQTAILELAKDDLISIDGKPTTLDALPKNLISTSEYESAQLKFQEVAANYRRVCAEMEDLARKERELLRQYTPAHPLVKNLHSKIDHLRAEKQWLVSDYPSAVGPVGQETHGEGISGFTAVAKTDPHAVEIARAEMDITKANLNIATANLKHTMDLVNQKAAARSQLEVAEAEMAKAEAKLRLAAGRFQASQSAYPITPQDTGASAQKKERLRRILADEIKVAESQASLAKKQYETGSGTMEDRLQAEFDLLSVRRELASIEADKAQLRELINQQLRLLDEAERATKQRREVGKATEADEFKLRRQVLQLQRQLAELE